MEVYFLWAGVDRLRPIVTHRHTGTNNISVDVAQEVGGHGGGAQHGGRGRGGGGGGGGRALPRAGVAGRRVRARAARARHRLLGAGTLSCIWVI